MIWRWAFLVALAVCGALSGMLLWIKADRDDLQAENARLSRSVEAFKTQAAQAEQARDVARAYQRAAQAEAREILDIVNQVERGGGNDVPLRPSVADAFNDINSRVVR